MIITELPNKPELLSKETSLELRIMNEAAAAAAAGNRALGIPDFTIRMVCLRFGMLMGEKVRSGPPRYWVKIRGGN